MNPVAYFLTLARYNAWATRRLLAAVAALDDVVYRKDVGLFFKSVHGTLNHLLVGEHTLWFVRFNENSSPRVALDAELENDRVRLAQRLTEGALRWEPLIASWPVERFDAALGYTTTKGVSVSIAFAAALGHVFNHGTHHRGQITAALTGLGQACPELDLVMMLQEESTK